MIANSFYAAIFTFAGWNYLNFVVEELQNPYKNLPRAIWISLPCVTIIYLLANIAYFAVLTPNEILGTEAVGVLFGSKTLGVVSWIVPVTIAMSAFGGLHGCIFASSRLFFVGARSGHLPLCLATVNVNYFTPIPALIFLVSIVITFL